MQTILTVCAGILLLYIVGDYLAKLIKFIFDDLLGKLIDTLRDWLRPITNFFESSQATIGARVDIFRVFGSLFLFAVAVGLSIVNYVLVYFGMELLIPGEVHLGILGFSAAALASISVVLLELALGFSLLELLGITDLLGWHDWASQRKWVFGIVVVLFLLFVIAAEAGIALYRLSQVGIHAAPRLEGVQLLISRLPYWVTFLLAIGVPLVTALSAFCLRDMLLILGWLIVTVFLIICKVVGLLLDILHSGITHIDDFLSAVLSVLTWPVEIVASFLVFVLVKLKVIPVFIILLFLLTGCPDKSAELGTSSARARFVVALMDNSGSFRTYFNRALANCKNYVDSLGFGDGFTLLLIDEESLRGDRPPFVETTWLPEAYTHIVPQQTRDQAASIRNGIKQRIDSAAGLRRGQATDLVGAIVRASRLLQQDTTKYIRHLLVFSDMQDTRGRGLLNGTSLDRVHVRLLFVDVTDIATQRNAEAWRSKLKELGAAEVLILNPDQSEGLRQFSLSRQ